MSVSLLLAFLAGSPGALELLVIFLAVLVMFGPRRLPEIAKTIGKVLSELRRASEEFKDQILSIDMPVNDSEAVQTLDAETETLDSDVEKQGSDHDAAIYDDCDQDASIPFADEKNEGGDDLER